MVGGTVPMILFVVLFLVNGASCVKCYVCSSDTCKKDTWIQIDCSIGCVKLEGFVYAKAEPDYYMRGCLRSPLDKCEIKREFFTTRRMARTFRKNDRPRIFWYFAWLLYYDS
ncbi:unnamed protein product [Bursaphelenchus xylophilus]|uniref:(pine wood nematode) hypothetical protein n=1 Tax=Bursaphelenchus xylophilus TaxID=6326 RepID=A0A7I8XP48_BURXY|nr:unnamed protein product [Bursaphelenchus xylophilus]CAG9120964.1 unnamed protein product [Bursaphelenchus xylophilus]